MHPLPLSSDLAQYQQQAAELLAACRAADGEALQVVRGELREFRKTSDREVANRVTSADAQLAVARWYDFESWQELAAWVTAVSDRKSQVARFEDAVEAIISGDEATLTRLLKEDRELIRVRSLRKHRATLLIYVGANGVEGYRQKTPKNAVRIAEILLDAGSDIEAVGTMYRGTTTLGLVATSVHPVITGVQEPLMELLLARGASFNGAVAPDYTDGFLVNACLANGRPAAAEFLFARGAPVNLEGAAALGKLELVQAYFDNDGRLTAGATEKQMKRAFKWACLYGRRSVVEFLLAKGVRGGEHVEGETGLHQAALGGHAAVVDMLLQHGASVDARDTEYDATPLGWAMWGWSNPSPEGAPPRPHDVVRRLVTAGSKVEQEWLLDENVRKDPAMLAALQANPAP